MGANGDKFLVERRVARRAATLRGTITLFSSNQMSVDTFYVNDISENGMLIFTNSIKKEYAVNSLITNIVILTPPSKFTLPGSKTGRPGSIKIRQGKVVRTFVNSENFTTAYGIIFTDDSSQTKKILAELVEQSPG